MRNRLFFTMLAFFLCLSVFFFVQPNYAYAADCTSEDVIYVDESTPMPASLEDVTYYAAKEDAALYIRSQLQLHSDSIWAGFPASATIPSYQELMDCAFAHTGDPSQGDYLNNYVRGYRVSTYTYSNGNIVYEFIPNYATTAAQQAQVDTAVAQILPQIRRDSDYHTVLDIYCWLLDNLTYTNSGDMIEHTAYGALVNRSCVCEGYASAFYRLCLECGIDCRFVTGDILGGGHAWNMVKLGGVYYEIDATNDIFLRCRDSVAQLLTLDAEYASSAFYAAYPPASQDYTLELDYHYDAATAHLSIDDPAIFTDYYDDLCEEFYDQYLGGVTNPNFHRTTLPWADAIREDVEKITFPQGLTRIPEGMFEYHSALKEVCFPATLTTVEQAAFYSCPSLETVCWGGTQEQWGAVQIGQYNEYLQWSALTFHPVVKKEGFVLEGGKLNYYTNGKIDAAKDGILIYEAQGHYFVDGVCDFSYNGFVDHTNGGKYLMENSKIAVTNSTAALDTDGSIYKLKSGKVDTTFTGIYKFDDILYYFASGKVDTSFEGLVDYKTWKIMVQEGKFNRGFYGSVAHTDGKVYLIRAGYWQDGYTGMHPSHLGTWLYFTNGIGNYSYDGLIDRQGQKYLIRQAEIQVKYTKSYEDSDGTVYMLRYGKWNQNYTTLGNHNGKVSYFVGGVLQKDFTGLVKYNNKLRYIENGVYNTSYTGSFTWEGKSYTIRRGDAV